MYLAILRSSLAYLTYLLTNVQVREMYLAIMLDRASMGPVIIACSEVCSRIVVVQ